MIEINLLPEELKSKVKKKKAITAIEPKYLLYIIPLFILGLLLCSHIIFAAVTVFKNNQLRVLNNKWLSLEPQRKMLDEFNKEYAIISEDALAIRKFADEKIDWAEKLNKLSLSLPPGIWFNDLSVAGGGFTLQGSVVSLEKEEMNLLKKFIDNLKNAPAFSKDFNKIELVSVQRRTISGYELFDFVLAGTLNTATNTKSVKGVAK
jgi:Tfp pilus assembly protein PilN